MPAISVAPRRIAPHDVIRFMTSFSAVRVHREVRLEQAGEEVALRLDVVRVHRSVRSKTSRKCAIAGVVDERRSRVGRVDVEELAHRRHRTAELHQRRGGGARHVAADVRRPSTRLGEHLLLDVVEPLVDRRRSSRSSGRRARRSMRPEQEALLGCARSASHWSSKRCADLVDVERRRRARSGGGP